MASKGPQIFQGLVAWFASDVPRAAISAWLSGGGELAAYPVQDKPDDFPGVPRLIFTTGEDAVDETFHLLQSQSEFRGLNLYHPNYILRCVEAGSLHAVSLWKYLLPNPIIQETTASALTGSKSSPLAQLPVTIVPSPNAIQQVDSVSMATHLVDFDGVSSDAMQNLTAGDIVVFTDHSRKRRRRVVDQDTPSRSSQPQVVSKSSTAESKHAEPDAVDRALAQSLPRRRGRPKHKPPLATLFTELPAKDTMSLFERYVLTTHAIRELDPELGVALAQQAPAVANASRRRTEAPGRKANCLEDELIVDLETEDDETAEITDKAEDQAVPAASGHDVEHENPATQEPTPVDLSPILGPSRVLNPSAAALGVTAPIRIRSRRKPISQSMAPPAEPRPEPVPPNPLSAQAPNADLASSAASPPSSEYTAAAKSIDEDPDLILLKRIKRMEKL